MAYVDVDVGLTIAAMGIGFGLALIFEALWQTRPSKHERKR